MNMFMNDMKNNIREIGHLVTTKGGDTRYMDIDPKVAQQMKTDAGVTGIETVTGTKIKEDDLIKRITSDPNFGAKAGGKVSKSKGGTVKKAQGHKKKTRKIYGGHHGNKYVAKLYKVYGDHGRSQL